MAKAEERRVRQSLERQRLKLKEDQLALVQERRELRRERTDAIIWLRLLCERYGVNAWPDETPLALILEKYLSDPLSTKLSYLRQEYEGMQAELERVRRAATQSPAPARPALPQAPPARPAAPRSPVPDQEPPRPLRPTLVPRQEHRTITVRASLRGQEGWKSTCICSWTSPLETSERTAAVSGARHCDAMADRLQQGAR